MKKIYFSAAALLACSLLNAQSAFTWDMTSYKGAFPVTDNTPATDWTSGWANWDPENVNYATPTSTLSGDITSNTSISGSVYLDGFVHVKNGATLTIAPGTVIRGKKDVSTPGVLVISRDSKIMAQGTSSQPIVFTSNESIANGRSAGDWGGLIILGNGVINTGGVSTNPNVSKVEGFLTVSSDRYYGGTNNTDNSGVLSYVRIEFAGISLDPATPNSEINGLTLGGVGSGTKMDHIQVSFSGDDSFEWFGGAVDAKYLISNRCTDDDFDTDFGFVGRIQFGLGIKDKDLSDISIASGASNGFESDNSDPINLRLPITKGVFSNMTMIGAKRDGTVGLPTGEKHECAMHIRRNSALSIFNSIFVGFEKGLRFQNAVTKDNFQAPALASDSLGAFANSIIAAGIPSTYIAEAGVFEQAWYHIYSTTNSNDTVTTAAQLDFVNGFASDLALTPDYRLNAASTASAGASFSHGNFTGGFTGVNELTSLKDNSFVLFPNPASNNVKISFDLTEKNKVTVLVFDVLGNNMSDLSSTTSFDKGYQTLNINTASLASGVYYISLEINNKKETKKLIINN